MKFTAKSSKYRDIAEQPVCRMYASPEKGMSNSHFYGIGSDCATLNKLSGLKYEGYDFDTKPTAEQASGRSPKARHPAIQQQGSQQREQTTATW